MDKVIKTIHFDPADIAIVEKLANDMGISFMAAVRVIVREWARTNPAKIVVTGSNGHEASN